MPSREHLYHHRSARACKGIHTNTDPVVESRILREFSRDTKQNWHADIVGFWCVPYIQNPSRSPVSPSKERYRSRSLVLVVAFSSEPVSQSVKKGLMVQKCMGSEKFDFFLLWAEGAEAERYTRKRRKIYQFLWYALGFWSLCFVRERSIFVVRSNLDSQWEESFMGCR